MDDFKKNTKHKKLKEEVLDRTLEKEIWKILQTCRKTDYGIIIIIIIIIIILYVFLNFHIRTVQHLDIIKVILFTNWRTSELS